jgi:hypothetical protein
LDEDDGDDDDDDDVVVNGFEGFFRVVMMNSLKGYD